MTTTPQTPQHPNAQLLENATKGFDYIFSNDLVSARKVFEGGEDSFRVMGLGVCAFLEAALGMESGLMTEASRCLALAEAGSRKEVRAPKPRDLAYQSRFHHGLEWEVLNADAVVLLGMTHALSESYMGYLQCLYSLNSAHSKFTKLYKTVFPAGLLHKTTVPGSEHLNTLPQQPAIPHRPSTASLSPAASIASTASGATISSPKPTKSFFARLVGAGASTPSLPIPSAVQPDGPIEEFIESGTAFGYGLFNLVFSLLPKKIQGVVGFLGFQYDRKLALSALSLSSSKDDIHGVFAGLILMTYLGVVLLLTGYQADEKRILLDYKTIVDKIETRYPQGALWILNRAKILRMSYDPEAAILVLKEGLKPGREQSFVQADTLLMFELAWTLLGQRKYEEAADAFIKLTEMNSWSHATYYFIAAGCRLAIGQTEKAQKLFDEIPELIDKRKISGKDLPTEVFIKKKLAFYKEKQTKKGGDPARFVECIRINPAEELALFWNTHARIDASIAHAHIDSLEPLTPSLSLDSEKQTPPSLQDDLSTPDEVAIRALLLGVNYRTLKEYNKARKLLQAAYDEKDTKTSTWVAGVSMFELAVLDLKEMEDKDDSDPKQWETVIKGATQKLDTALSLATSSVDLSSRLDSRITMLRDQLAEKRELLSLD